MTMRRPRPPHRFVYVIGPAVGLQKVGLATDPKARLAALRTACPFDLVLHVAVPVPFGEAHAVERAAHVALAAYRAAGEWFETTPGAAVAAVQKAAGSAVEGASVQLVPAKWRAPRVTVEALPLFAYERTRPRQPVSRRPLWWQMCSVAFGRR